MLCRNVNRILQVSAMLLMSTSVFATTPIERTVLAYYDLSNHKTEHHEISIVNSEHNSVYTFTPMDHPSGLPTTFTISGCINSTSSTTTKGILSVNYSQTNASDVRLATMGAFASEHNFRGIWLHLSPERYLFFSPETDGMLQTSTITPNMKRCR